MIKSKDELITQANENFILKSEELISNQKTNEKMKNDFDNIKIQRDRLLVEIEEIKNENLKNYTDESMLKVTFDLELNKMNEENTELKSKNIDLVK